MASKNDLTIEFFPISTVLDARSVKSAAQYILLGHLQRGLVSLDKDGNLVSDLAVSWKVSKDFKTFEFKLKPDQKFSNGDEIVAQDFAETFKWQIKSLTSIHGDFAQLDKVVAATKYDLKLVLKESDSNFLKTLTHVEFGVAHKSDVESSKPSYKISSGRYILESLKLNEAVLIRNPFSQDIKNNFHRVIFKSNDPSIQLSSIQEGTSQIVISYAGDEERYLKLLSDKNLYKFSPHIGFTHWLSLNVNSGFFADLKNRSLIYSLLKSSNGLTKDRGRWHVANQLYLPGGPGRLTIEEEKSFHSKLKNTTEFKKTKKLNLLLPKNLEFNDIIAKVLSSVAEKVEVIQYENQEDFFTKNTSDIDAFVMNNDFSSLDLLQNILVTFNENRPLIYPDKKIKKLLLLLKAEATEAERSTVYHKIGIHLLEESIIVPLFYNRINFYHSKSVNLDEWSTIYPEVAVWKLVNK